MEMSGMVPAVLSGMSIAAVVLLGVWRMLAHYEKRNAGCVTLKWDVCRW